MAIVKPFAALRPKPDLALRICELPYDVMSSDEARQLAFGNPLSFLHVSKPEIDLPLGTDPYSPAVYAQGRLNLDALIAQGALLRDPQACFYLYRQTMGQHTQTGFVGVCSCEEYLQGIVRRHELTRPDKEDDRVRHIETLNSQTGPVFLVYPESIPLSDLVTNLAQQPPAVDFVASDGIRHTAWVIVEKQDIEFVEAQFAEMPRLYIADGHHRSAAAARVYQSRKPPGASTHFLCVLFPHTQVKILPYNRALKDLNGLEPFEFARRLEEVMVRRAGSDATPTRSHEVCLYLDGRWHPLQFRPELLKAANPVDTLDVSLLQRFVLAPLLGIDDPRTSKRIQFIGGIRGTEELEKRVDSGEFACAFSMYPTGIEELMTIADANGIMPPKSTWFEPKLRDAMFCHML